MSGIAHKAEAKIEQVAGKFYHSGDKGTTGREPFEDGTPVVPATGGGHSHHGVTDSHSHGLTGNNHSGLTGNQHGTGTGTGLGSTGATGTTGLSGNHSHGLTGTGLSSETTARSDLGQTHGSTAHGTGLAAAAAQGTTGHGYNTVGSDSRGTGSALHTLGGGENTTSTGLTGDSHHGHDHHIGGGHRNEATRNTAAALGAGSVGTHSNPGAQGNFDRVGSLSQNAHQFEQTGPTGPATHGAAGTDRFDTGKHHPGVTSSHPPVPDDKKQHGTGGIGGVLGTTDKDFLSNRDRIATGGAYNDDHKHFQSNTTGPGGNAALTGREGSNLEHNPVAQAGTAGTGVGGLSHGTAGQGVHDTELDEHGNPKKKSIIDKVKEVLS